MVDQDRTARLRALARDLERQAPSDDRDRLLRETRARITDLQVGPTHSPAFSQNPSSRPASLELEPREPVEPADRRELSEILRS